MVTDPKLSRAAAVKDLRVAVGKAAMEVVGLQRASVGFSHSRKRCLVEAAELVDVWVREASEEIGDERPDVRELARVVWRIFADWCHSEVLGFEFVD